jgi:hypothetical protein
MSWWDTGEGDNVIGDAPADLMGDALSEISYAREKRSQPNPNIQQLIDGFAHALKTYGSGDKGLTLKRSGGDDITARAEDSDEEIAKAFQTGFQQIARKYKERWDRDPRVQELAELLTFVLGYQPERYMSDAQGLKVRRISIG